MNLRTALLGVFLVLTVVLASTTVYESRLGATATSTSTVTTVTTVTAPTNSSSLVVTKEVVLTVETEFQNDICVVFLATSTTSSATSYLFPPEGSHGALTVETTTTTFDTATTIYENATMVGVQNGTTVTCTEINPHYNVTQTSTQTSSCPPCV